MALRPLGVAEAIWSDGYDTHAPSTVRTWHGAAPYLDTPDQDGSYGQIGDVFADPDPAGYVGIRVPATSIAGPIPSFSVKVQAWSESPEILGTVVYGRPGSSLNVYAEWDNEPNLPGGTWVDVELSSDASDFGAIDVEGFRADLAAGAVQVLVGVGTNVRVSFIQLLVPGEVFIPLRQFHRDDGYGVTPPRAFGGASRIRTGRAYGYD